MKVFSRVYWEQRDVNQIMGKLLRYGVISSCAITFIGGILYIFQNQGESMEMYKASDVPNALFGANKLYRGLSTIIPRMLLLDGAAIIQFGVCVLIATPIMRVAFSVLVFLAEKDYLYVVITLIVLCIILVNMTLGLC